MIELLVILSLVMIIIGTIGIIKGSLKTFRIYNRKGSVLFTLAMFVVLILSASLSGNKELSSTTNEPDNAKSSSSAQNVLKFSGDMSLSIKEKNIVATIHSNVPDGGLFEITVLSGQFNVQSTVLPIENGEIIYEAQIQDDWEPSYYVGMAIFRFNADNITQPNHIKEIYGEHGEKMTGNMTQENHLGGKNGILQSKQIAYPDEESVKKLQADKVKNALSEAVKNSDGIILDIQAPDWDTIYVFVSDDWYYLPEYQQERFAQTIGTSLEDLIKKSGLSNIPNITFKDSFGATVASKSFLGDYKIKK